eukprot:666138-Pyramimonas_sp.AAC.1
MPSVPSPRPHPPSHLPPSHALLFDSMPPGLPTSRPIIFPVVGGPRPSQFCAGKWAGGQWNSKDLVTLAHLAKESEGRGLETLTVGAGKSGRNESRNIQRALGVASLDEYLYRVSVPLFDANANKNELTTFPMRLPHEIIYNAAIDSPSDLNLGAVDPHNYMTRQYLGHPIVRRFGAGRVLPVGIYTDKLAVGKTDSIVRRPGYLSRVGVACSHQ